MSKRKITILFKPLESNIDDYDEEVGFDYSNAIDIERMIMQIEDQQEVQVLLLRYMGYDYKEIANIMNLKSVGDYYIIWRRLRNDMEIIQKNEV